MLEMQEREQLMSHLLRLGPKGRYSRFSATLNDAMVAAYVIQTFSASNFYVGFFDQDILRGVVEIHDMGPNGQSAELAFSIELGWRGQGVGARLFAAAVAAARYRSVRFLHIHCLAHNFAMVALLRRFQARMTYEDNEVSAVIAC